MRGRERKGRLMWPRVEENNTADALEEGFSEKGTVQQTQGNVLALQGRIFSGIRKVSCTVGEVAPGVARSGNCQKVRVAERCD